MIEIENRRSIRKYQDKEIEKSDIHKLIESARLAPSGDNTQPWHFVVINDKSIIAKVSEVSHNQKWMKTVPVLIVCVADIRVRIKDDRQIVLSDDSNQFEVKQIIRDTAISIEHIVLEAVHLGLGTCWVSWYNQDEIRQTLGIPEDKFVVTVLTVGYPDENPSMRPRKKQEDLVHWNKW